MEDGSESKVQEIGVVGRKKTKSGRVRLSSLKLSLSPFSPLVTAIYDTGTSTSIGGSDRQWR